ncbi:MAG: hypothetical protein CFE24_01880 [Flavobacterium sp. BFFFF2]|nr:MAG: hypothetical protein CFE24_01880 [Flavobacterium sp. BFFFF2]
MNSRKILLGLITLSTLYSCSTRKISESELLKINGIYEANNIGNTIENAHHYNFISLLHRRLFKDTLVGKPIFNYRFKIIMLDSKHLEISIINEVNKVISKRKYGFRRREDFIILKNKNTHFLLIPYLAGALDLTKLKIKSNKDGNLNIKISEHRSGGAFMIPMGWSDTKSTENYKRVE